MKNEGGGEETALGWRWSTEAASKQGLNKDRVYKITKWLQQNCSPGAFPLITFVLGFLLMLTWAINSYSRYSRK